MNDECDRGVTISPCSRAALSSCRGAPSSVNRASTTMPRCSPSAANTGRLRRSLRITATPWDAGDDVVAEPALDPGGIERIGRNAQPDERGHLGDVLPSDPAES